MLNCVRWAAPALLLVAGLCNSADAKLFGRLQSDEEIPAPVMAAPGMAAPMISAIPMAASLNAGDCCPPCCPTPCITYRHAGLRKVKCCGCEPPVQTVLCVSNPCTCCPVNVPVCLPSCCTGAPAVACRGGILCDGVVTYDWCCGVTVSVKFKKCGDVVVTYRGV
ncbi:MAG: hypothetical protein JSS27_08750 [Planctomycetes bacterium]|nr:hypothetical protein [Planctomycetota bacterium]